MKLRGLRQARQRLGISIGQLAEATGLRRETIAHLEHGQEEPQPYALRRLTTVLGVTAEELCAGPGPNSGVSPVSPYHTLKDLVSPPDAPTYHHTHLPRHPVAAR